MRHARADYDAIQDPRGLIPDDEPVFLIRAQDQLAPATLRYWAGLLERNGGDRKMVNRVMDWANEMERWQADRGRKLPDMPEPEEST